MLDKLTDNMKFFLMLLIYVGYISWWAAGITTTQTQITATQTKIVLLLDSHIDECSERNNRIIIVEEKVIHLRHDVDDLLDIERMKIN